MNDYEETILNEFGVHCPKNIILKYNHKHQDAQNWTRFYYYKNKKKIAVPPENIDYDYEVSSTLAYNKNVFYKMVTMSDSDVFFDYYFKLKPSLPKIVVKRTNRKTQRLKNIEFDLPEPEITKNGKVIVRFL